MLWEQGTGDVIAGNNKEQGIRDDTVGTRYKGGLLWEQGKEDIAVAGASSGRYLLGSLEVF